MSVVEIDCFRDSEPQDAMPQGKNRRLRIDCFCDVPSHNYARFCVLKSSQIQSVSLSAAVHCLDVQRVIVCNPDIIGLQVVIHPHNVRHAAVSKCLVSVPGQFFDYLCNIVFYMPPETPFRWDFSQQFRVKQFRPVQGRLIAPAQRRFVFF